MMAWGQALKLGQAALYAVALVCIAFQAEAGDVTGVRFGKQTQGTRVVIDLSGPVEPSIFLLENPYRVVVDLPDSQWKAAQETSASGIVAKYRHGLFRPDTYRLVLELEEPAILSKSFALSPSGRYGHRYVLDLKAASKSDYSAAVEASKSRRLVAQAPSPAPSVSKKPKNEKPLVIIDPGHGGTDPGTLGVLGVNEKVIALAIGKRIKKRLEATGRYRAKLTRDRDFFIPLRQRYKIAQSLGAELFISIHADSIANKNIRGGTVYTLSETASDREAARLAARENKSDVIAGLNLNDTDDEVSSILIDLAQRETLNDASRFAELLLTEMRKEVRMHKRGHRSANLAMLKAPDIPSVLLEVGYMTNREDARMLNTRAAQEKIADAVGRGVDQFFEQAIAYSR